MLKLKLIGILATLLFSVSHALATAQAPDKIFFNGKEYALHSNPMEDYFVKFPDKKPQSEIISSGLWRGYLATFEIADNGLYLKDIEIMVNNDKTGKGFERGWQSVFSKVVPNGKKLKIDWFSGILVLPHGKLVNYVHMGYASTYENYALLEIDRGDLKKSKEFNYLEYEKFKERQFEAFKQTPEYKKMFDDMKKRDPNSSEESINSFIRTFVISYSSKILVE